MTLSNKQAVGPRSILWNAETGVSASPSRRRKTGTSCTPAASLRKASKSGEYFIADAANGRRANGPPFGLSNGTPNPRAAFAALSLTGQREANNAAQEAPTHVRIFSSKHAPRGRLPINLDTPRAAVRIPLACLSPRIIDRRGDPQSVRFEIAATTAFHLAARTAIRIAARTAV